MAANTTFVAGAIYTAAQSNDFPRGQVAEAGATATTSIANVTATTILTKDALIVPGRIYSVSGLAFFQSGSIIGSKAMWFAQSSFLRQLFYTGLAQGANLPFSMGGTSYFAAADVGVTTGSGTTLTFTLRVRFSGGATGLNTNPDGVIGAGSAPQIFLITDVGSA